MKKYKTRAVDEILKNKLQSKGAVIVEMVWKNNHSYASSRKCIKNDEPSNRNANIRLSEFVPE